MPTNKNAQFRYQILDRCFSDYSREYDFDTLLEKVNDYLVETEGILISVRQLRCDINAIRKMLPTGVYLDATPFEGEKRCFYRYCPTSFSIYKNELSVKEVQKLRSTIDMLNQYRGMPNNIWLEEVISTLEYRFGIKSNKDNVVSFEQNEQLKGLEFLGDLIDATSNRQPLNVLYRSFYGTEHNTIVHPYHLKQFNNRWFLLGLEETNNGNRITNKALDRIVKISVAEVPYIPNTDINFADFFKDIVGVTIPQDHPNAEKVVLKFDSARFPYVVSKPIHSTQEVISEEEHTLRIIVRPNKELEAQIFSYGPQVEVIEPQWLRKQIEEKIKESLKKYSSGKKDCTA